MFQGMGRIVLSADSIARDVVESDPLTREKIRKEFGREVFGDDGILDRKRLAAIVFADRRRRKALDAIVHPVVFQRLESAIRQFPPERLLPYLLIEAALIFESGMDKDLDYTIVVEADEESRVRRIIKRDGLHRDEILLRMASQMDVRKKTQLADFTIVNAGSEDDLVEKVKFIDRILSSMHRV